MAKTATTRLRFPMKDAQDILLAQVLETSESEKSNWSAADRIRATEDAFELAGEERNPVSFLPLRARLVLARLKARVPDQRSIRAVNFATAPIILGLILAAYLAGAFTDRFATDGAKINLLSAPILLLLLWNAAIYIGLLLNACGILPKPRLSLRASLAEAFSRLRWSGLSHESVRARFAALWAASRFEVFSLEAARACHLAAAAFAIGLATSLFVRGIGTAYTVGWESTWLAESPVAVEHILRVLYGLLPLSWLGVPPFPDSTVIAALRFDLGNSAIQTAGASAWLIRLMALLAAGILIPRLILAGVATLRLRHARTTAYINTDIPYFHEILKAPAGEPASYVLLVDAPTDDSLPEGWQRLQKELQQTLGKDVRLQSADAWSCDTDSLLRALPPNGRRHTAVGFDPMTTPEAEVHGAMLSALFTYAETHHDPLPIVVLDLSTVYERLGEDSPTVRSRQALWETFAAEYHLAAVGADLRSDTALQSAVERLTSLGFAHSAAVS